MLVFRRFNRAMKVTLITPPDISVGVVQRIVLIGICRLPINYNPSALRLAWSSGRRLLLSRAQRNFRSVSLMGRSLILANRRAIRPSGVNCQFSLPYDLNQLPASSCHS